jgi:HAD superfamily hydrolase (TIGR01549 family)
MDFEALLSPAVPARAAILDAIRLDVAGELASFYLYSDTARSLTALRDLGVPTALVSNVAHPYVALLRHAFEPLVDHFVLSCEVGVAKPSPHIFGLACRLLRREAHCVLMVGDSLRSDIEPATRLGMLAARINRRPRDGSRPSHELSAILSAHWALPQEESSE